MSIQNNNPGNIRRGSTHWVGEDLTDQTGEFVVFISPEYGIRAIAKIIHSYKREGLDTISLAINRWAPPSENNTDSYVSDVCRRCGVGPHDVVDFAEIMPILVKAIIRHEEGEQPYTDTQINAGIGMADE